MNVLGIETSCDETAAAVLRFPAEGPPEILAEQVLSQIKLHAEYGGVVPELASREHLHNLPLIVEETLRQSNVALNEIDLIGVTSGPGLKGCLLIGVEFARGLGAAMSIQVTGINHIEGHLHAPRLDNPHLAYPYLALVASGGHTEIVAVEGLGKYTILARTTDDAAGEAFDKSAALLDIPYPGGPLLAATADLVSERDPGLKNFPLPRVMQHQSDFSFSGLKTAISLMVQRHKKEGALDEEKKKYLCRAVQNSIVQALTDKVEKARAVAGMTRIVVTGGVAANRFLREKLLQLSAAELFFPTAAHCVDNAAMIGLVAGERKRAGLFMNEKFAVKSQWPVEELT